MMPNKTCPQCGRLNLGHRTGCICGFQWPVIPKKAGWTMESSGAMLGAGAVFLFGTISNDSVTRITSTIIACAIFIVACWLYYRKD